MTAFYDTVKVGGLYFSVARAGPVQEGRDLTEAIENRWHKLQEQAETILYDERRVGLYDFDCYLLSDYPKRIMKNNRSSRILSQQKLSKIGNRIFPRSSFGLITALKVQLTYVALFAVHSLGTIELLIPRSRLPFACLAREIANSYSGQGIRFKAAALRDIQKLAESHLTTWFECLNHWAVHGKRRVTSQKKDAECFSRFRHTAGLR